MKNINAFIAIASLVGGLNGCKPLDPLDIIRMDRINKVNRLLSDAKITISGDIVASCEILVTSDKKKAIETFSCNGVPLVSDEQDILEGEGYVMKIKNLSKDPKNPGFLNIEAGCMGIITADPAKDIIHGTTCVVPKDETTTKKPKLTT